ncbi:MAG: hypothetical protein ACRCZ3_03235 [Providencia rustigianii]|uniref:hypothetical protein n=1 Tax=Providencia rustigianii TaxID=158850 RepID=UPI003F37AA3F
MITIPFSLFGFTDWLLYRGEGGLVIMFATFGMIPASIVVALVMRAIGLKNYIAPVAFGMMSSMFVSMIVMIPMLLMFGLSDIPKAILIWMVVVVSCIIFFLVNINYIDIWNSSLEGKELKNSIKSKKNKAK